MKRILITGGAGFIGSNFVRYWLANHPNDRIVNLDALTYAGNPESLADVSGSPNYRFVHGNICDAEVVTDLLAQEKIDTVVNFAAESHVDRSILGPEEFIRTNIFGTFSLLEAAKVYWAGETSSCRFLHVSTDEVYGTLAADDPPFTEETPFAPNSPYAASKASSDHLVRAYSHTYGLPVVTTNCSNNYGPYQFPEKLIPLVIINALEGREIPIYGDGMNIRDWLHVADHCRGIDAVLSAGRLGETYNIGGNNEWANINIVKQICGLLDERRPGESPRTDLIAFVKDRPGHDLRYAINAGKMMNELGWTPRHTFETGIVETVDWYLNNSEWLNHVRDGAYRDYYQTQYD
jgi:dTDP-glucose 4,6-dehydratase